MGVVMDLEWEVVMDLEWAVVMEVMVVAMDLEWVEIKVWEEIMEVITLEWITAMAIITTAITIMEWIMVIQIPVIEVQMEELHIHLQMIILLRKNNVFLSLINFM